jgi:hypothetical protein
MTSTDAPLLSMRRFSCGVCELILYNSLEDLQPVSPKTGRVLELVRKTKLDYLTSLRDHTD